LSINGDEEHRNKSIEKEKQSSDYIFLQVMSPAHTAIKIQLNHHLHQNINPPRGNDTIQANSEKPNQHKIALENKKISIPTVDEKLKDGNNYPHWTRAIRIYANLLGIKPMLQSATKPINEPISPKDANIYNSLKE
jgi:hypothetical protein